ncbi:MAG: hypothetical protein ACFFG0_26350 [Candidatus Thorarchaeota archaeon]
MITNYNNCIGYLIQGNCIEYGLIIDGNIQFNLIYEVKEIIRQIVDYCYSKSIISQKCSEN